MTQSLYSYAKYLALPLSGPLTVALGAALDWLSSQAEHDRKGAAQRQPFGPGLLARRPASSLGCVSAYTPSFFLVLRASSSRREALGI